MGFRLSGIRLATIPLSILLVASLYAPSAKAASTEELTVAFMEADLDDDGYLSIDEYVGYLVQIFASKDTNRDGFLSPAEIPDVSDTRFSSADRDADGAISLGEGMGSKVVDFFDADTNRDGLMDQGELLAMEERLASE